MWGASVALVLVALTIRVHSRSDGAPAEACATLTPQHPGTVPQTSDVPYTIDLSSFGNAGSDGYFYEPGRSYQCESELLSHVPHSYRCTIVQGSHQIPVNDPQSISYLTEALPNRARVSIAIYLILGPAR